MPITEITWKSARAGAAWVSVVIGNRGVGGEQSRIVSLWRDPGSNRLSRAFAGRVAGIVPGWLFPAWLGPWADVDRHFDARPYRNRTLYQQPLDDLVRPAGCGLRIHKLRWLRHLPAIYAERTILGKFDRRPAAVGAILAQHFALAHDHRGAAGFR